MGPPKLITLRKSLRKCTTAEPKNHSAGVIHGLIVPVHPANLSSIGYSRKVRSGCFHCGSVGSQGFCWHSGEESPPLGTFAWGRVCAILFTGTHAQVNPLPVHQTQLNDTITSCTNYYTSAEWR